MESGCVFCRCYKNTEKKPKTYKPEREASSLKNWEKWLEERRRVHSKLSQALNKPAGELLMNINEEKRQVQEEKLLYTHTRINTYFEKYRGNPEFWELPVGLKNKCGCKNPIHFTVKTKEEKNVPVGLKNKCGCKNPIYFTVKTKEEKNEIPSLEYVGTPDLILEEKNVLPRTRNLYEIWKKSSYRQTFMLKTFSKLCLLQPHQPDMSKLIVLGKKYPPEYPLSPCPDFSFEMIKKPIYHPPISFEVNAIPKLFVKINGIVFSSKVNVYIANRKIRVFFSSNNMLESPLIKTLKLENIGRATVRFYWKRYAKFRTFRDIHPNQEEPSPFYFNSTELLLVPGNVFELPIYFKPKTTGHFFESWEITTKPRIWDESFKLIVCLQGVLYDGNIREEAIRIREMLDTKTRNTLIREILNESLKDLRCMKSVGITYTYTEKELFECANQESNPAKKTSKYVYNETVIGRLKEFYNQMKAADDDDQWDFSIEKLKAVTRKRDIADYMDTLAEKCNRAKHKLSKLQSDVTERESKSSSTENTEADPIELKPVGTNYKNLETLISQLERPFIIRNKERGKYASVYFILRRYLFKIF
ncbi:hypothetical protein JTB14_023001 [Gonioctena quinquepunctata]|nr:hypothetical protein JTB14_023001 [Gonioctena quinquepunctata]